MSRGSSFVFVVVASIALGAACGVSACSSGSGDDGPASLGADDDGGAPLGDDGGGLILGDAKPPATLTSIEVSPATASIESLNGAHARQHFDLSGKSADGATIPLDGDVAWSANAPQIGAMIGSSFDAAGAQGGVVTVKATYKGKVATAALTVKLRIETNTAKVDDVTKDALRAATVADGATTWAYPYDDTVFPRGLAGPKLMWNGGAPTDVYRVHVESTTFSYEDFVTTTPPSRVDLPADVWNKFVESTAGASSLVVQRSTTGAGAKATLVTKLGWTIAPGSMRGTIYYWSNRQGRVMRIKPGAAEPDDFSAASLAPSACTMTCHSVSADGSTLSSGGDGLGGTYDLLANKPRHALTGDTTATRSWNFAALTPNGKSLVMNGNGAGGLYNTSDGALVAGSGIDKVPTWMPAFTPDGTSFLYTDYSGGPNNRSLMAYDFDVATSKFTNNRLLVTSTGVADKPFIAYPSGTPDGLWAVYQRSTVNNDTRGQCVSGEPACRYDNRSDLYLANVKAPGVELALSKANGTGYPFAAGERDRSWNFEPTFAPIASGGYYWVVFTSRRTYGNMNDAAHSTPDQMKQLWVFAIEQKPAAGKDPSHAAFRLPGQALTFADASGASQNSLNMRGFWALDPCKSDGGACGTGSECCGGYCEDATCKSAPPPCSTDGDHCNKDSDCCDGTLTCINHVCSQPPPR